jgi:hypothetical protein
MHHSVEKELNKTKHELLHVQMAEIQEAKENLGAALFHYQAALAYVSPHDAQHVVHHMSIDPHPPSSRVPMYSLNPRCLIASQGIEAINKLMFKRSELESDGSMQLLETSGEIEE